MFRKTIAIQYKLYKEGLKSLKTILPSRDPISAINTQLLRRLSCLNEDKQERHTKRIAINSNETSKKLQTYLSKITKPHILFCSTVAVQQGSQLPVEPLPEPPLIPEIIEAVQQLNALGEPSLASLGLGGWFPPGLIQHALEFAHVSLGLPWWGSIVLGTVIVRLLMFPLVIISQKNAARMTNNLPEMQELQRKLTEARQYGDRLEAARYSQQLVDFMKERDVNPFKNMIVPLVQMPFFVSFFMGLRKMANAPVESMAQGGMLWFTDLTVPDQYFILPIITSVTLLCTIELGTDAAKLSAQNMKLMKYIFRGMPLVIFPFTMNFPAAILCYWCSSNFMSLLQVGFLRIPRVRAYFNIDQLVKHDKTVMKADNKGFVGGLKDTWNNMKITRQLEERRRYDEIQFQRAGKGPVTKTYTYDPTKFNDSLKAVSAKKR